MSRVCILTSGVGSRMGRFAKLTNKALLPLGGKAIISHIIDKFPASTEFVISLGYLGEYVKAYLALAHPQIRFHYVTVDKYEGPGSGPAYSLLCCKPELPSAFYFVSCDTLWHDSFDFTPSERSWFAAAPVAFEDMEDYCCFRSDENRISEIVDKQKPSDPHSMLKLYTYASCPYCAKVRSAFAEMKVEFSEVMMTDDAGAITLGADVKAIVKAEILTGLVQGDKVIAFKMKRRKGFRKKHGHRTHYTKIQVTEIA